MTRCAFTRQQTGVGVGQRGRTETFVQLHPDLLSDEHIGYLWLLFSADALKPDGTFISRFSKAPANMPSTLGSRLRERIYDRCHPTPGGIHRRKAQHNHPGQASA